MAHLIDKDAVLAEIDRIENGLMDAQGNFAYREDEGAYHTLCSLENFINSLEVKEVDLELITGWFDHIAQMADDRKTLNGEVMEDWAALDEIKCLARNSSEFIKKHYKTQNKITISQQRLSVLKMEFWTGLETFNASEMTLSDAYNKGIEDILEELNIEKV